MPTTSCCHRRLYIEDLAHHSLTWNDCPGTDAECRTAVPESVRYALFLQEEMRDLRRERPLHEGQKQGDPRFHHPRFHHPFQAVLGALPHQNEWNSL